MKSGQGGDGDKAGGRDGGGRDASERDGGGRDGGDRDGGGRDGGGRDGGGRDGGDRAGGGGRDGGSSSSSSSSSRSSSRTNVNVSTEQRTKIRSTLVKSGGGNRVSVSNLGVSVSVGTRIPRGKVTVQTLPSSIIEIVPEYRGYSYFITEDDVIVIVEPDTYEIVYVIEG
jgi:hypothetical protein